MTVKHELNEDFIFVDIVSGYSGDHIYAVKKVLTKEMKQYYACLIEVSDQKIKEQVTILNEGPLDSRLRGYDLMHNHSTNTFVICFTDKSYVIH